MLGVFEEFGVVERRGLLRGLCRMLLRGVGGRGRLGLCFVAWRREEQIATNRVEPRFVH